MLRRCENENWPIGRIIELHFGEDGVVRVFTIRSCHGYYKRPVVKVAKIEQNNGFETMVKVLPMRNHYQGENVEDK
jgi:hypothetical protein